MRAIRVQNGEVREVADTGSETIEDWRKRFNSGIGGWFANDTAKPGWSWDADTKTAKAPPAPTADDLRPGALSSIDDKAGEVRGLYITEIPGQQGTYLLKQQQAQAYKAAGYPSDTSPYPFVQAKADAMGDTPKAAADLILSTAAQWVQVGASIEREREKGKKNVNDASDASGVESARDAAISALEALKP